MKAKPKLNQIDAMLRALTATGAGVITITVAPSLRKRSGVAVHVETVHQKTGRSEHTGQTLEDTLIELVAAIAIATGLDAKAPAKRKASRPRGKAQR